MKKRLKMQMQVDVGCSIGVWRFTLVSIQVIAGALATADFGNCEWLGGEWREWRGRRAVLATARVLYSTRIRGARTWAGFWED